MPTYYVEDYDGERNDDAVDAAPAETDATPVEEATAKVVKAEHKPSPKSSARATTKGR